MYQEVNPLFEAQFARQSGQKLRLMQSHGGSSRQSRAVLSGEQTADVVTLGLYLDIDLLRKRGLIASGWADRLPHHSQPYSSTIIFVVRHGNPKRILDWPDLLHEGVEIVTPDPRTSGNGKLSALAAWGAIVTRGGAEADEIHYLASFYRHVRVLDAGARGAAATFALAEVGDVHLTWENEAIREVAESHGALQIRLSAAQHPRRTVRGLGGRQPAQARHRTSGARVSAIPVHRPNAADHRTPRLSAVSGPAQRATTAHCAIARDWDDAQQKFFADGGIIDGALREGRP